MTNKIDESASSLFLVPTSSSFVSFNNTQKTMSLLIDSFRRLLRLDDDSPQAKTMDRYKILRELNQ